MTDAEEIPQVYKDYKDACMDSVLTSKRLF